MQRTITYEIDKQGAGRDIRGFLRAQGYSRHILAHIKPLAHAVLVNGKHELLRYELKEGDRLQITIEDEAPSAHVIPAPVPFRVAYEDEDLLVIDKPAGVSIHPAPGHPADTLANGLAHYYEQQGIPFVFRCINRLDRDTTGLLIVAKNLISASILEQALQAHAIRRTYLALAEGEMTGTGTVDLPIARKEGSLIERCVDERGDRAVTHYRLAAPEELLSSLPADGSAGNADSFFADLPATPLILNLETGRTHQIRVHMAAIGHPLLGDSLYNPRWAALYEKGVPTPGAALPLGLGRQALHSWKLEFSHPVTKRPMRFVAPVPEDLVSILYSLS